MSEGLGPSPEEMGIEEDTTEIEGPEGAEPETLAVAATLEVDDRPLAVDEIAVSEIGLIPDNDVLFPRDRQEAPSGVDLDRARAIDRFFLEKAAFLSATPNGQDVVAVHMLCLDKTNTKAPSFGRVTEIIEESDPQFPDHKSSKFRLEGVNGEQSVVERVKPVYDLSAKDLAKLPAEYMSELTVQYEPGPLTIGQYVRVQGADLVGRVAYHLDQSAFPGKIGVVLRDATLQRAHLVAVPLDSIAPRD